MIIWTPPPTPKSPTHMYTQWVKQKRSHQTAFIITILILVAGHKTDHIEVTDL